MKFHGIDMQGRFLVEEAADPTWVGADDRRMVRNTDNGRILFGTSTGWDEIVLASQGLPAELVTSLDAVYHQVGGEATVPMVASTYTGDGSDNLRVTDNWIKLSDNTSLTTGGTAGLRIEYGLTTSDADDITLFYDYDSPDAGIYPTHWQLDGGGYTADPIATHSYVAGQLSTDLDGFWDKTELDLRYVRHSDPTGEGTANGNTTHEDWAELTADVLGSGITQRRYYKSAESHGGFVRVSNWTEYSPANAAAYASITSVASTIVQRDGSADIWCNVLHGIATSAQYADLAEKYTCDETLPVGTVVGVMPDSEYEVEPFASDFMHGAIGVVSESPAYLMNSESDGLPIALTGKVPVRVIGMVEKGDFLVPVEGGVARKGDIKSAIDRDLKFATVLEDGLQISEKLVECIVK